VADRRSTLVAAAVTVLAGSGSRGLTHRAVDGAAGLPPGSASNCFRTREALLEGVLHHVLDTERSRLAALPAGGVEAVLDGARQMTRFLLGPGRELTVARHAIFLESLHHPEMRRAVAEASARTLDLVAARLALAGLDDPRQRARLLLVGLDGFLLDRLVRGEDAFGSDSALTALIISCLSAPLPGSTD
jgi:AcrR family transcriptional regulator